MEHVDKKTNVMTTFVRFLNKKILQNSTNMIKYIGWFFNLMLQLIHFTQEREILYMKMKREDVRNIAIIAQMCIRDSHGTVLQLSPEGYCIRYGLEHCT